jgi:hypothetical protein
MLEQPRKVETAVEARQGFLDRPVLIVLAISLGLTLLCLGARKLQRLVAHSRREAHAGLGERAD